MEVDYREEGAEPLPTPKATPAERPIDMLKPNSEMHEKVKNYLLDRLKYSERCMSGFYSRWNANEKKIQAYISLPDYERQLKMMTDRGEPAQPISVTIPYSFATIWTIVTYLTHTFCGQKPIFQVSTYNADQAANAPYMETVLQFNSDHTALILRIIQWFLDAETYGVGAVRALWKDEFTTRTTWTNMSPGGVLAPHMNPMNMRQKTQALTFQGSEVVNIDPFCFFPDPRVPMVEVKKRGEFVFWRSFEGRHTLKRAESLGQLAWIDDVSRSLPYRTRGESSGTSQRSLVAKGDAMPGDPMTREYRATPFIQIDQGTVEIIPRDLGFSDSEVPEKWLFSLGNQSQVIQAEPLDYDHGEHPVSVIEPSSFGYAFGQPGTMDFLGPIQDALSWFLNSHIYNVRTALNNMWIVDPSMVEMQDLKNPSPGKIIRLKRSAFGQDVKTAIQQLAVQDVTANHIQSMEIFLRMGDVLSAVNDNLRGIQESGGRKTATEVRTAGEAGASRLAARARFISAQGMVPLARQMSMNLQQRLDMKLYLEIVGKNGVFHDITPEMIVGDFYYPVSDGTLPTDKTALLNVWKEIWMAIAQNPQLAPQYDAGRIFEYIAELGGAKNISNFKIAPDQQLAGAAAAGNAVPLGDLARAAGGGAPGSGRPRSNGAGLT